MAKAEQLPLEPEGPARPSARKARPAKPPTELATTLPVAQVRIDTLLPHLDRDFDYVVPAPMDALAQPGARVRVRFAGRLVGGIIRARTAQPEVAGTLRPLERVVGPEPVLTPETLELVEAVAERYAGTFSDVVRLAVPPRHARAEVSVPIASIDHESAGRSITGLDADAGWAGLAGGVALLDRARAGTMRETRMVWSAPPASEWSAMVAVLVRAVLTREVGGVLIVVPDAADTEQLAAELAELAEVCAVLRADHGPERRYREFLRVLRGHARVVIGTRTAVFAPVRDLEFVIVWNDGEDTLWESHAPYWNARDVAALRSHHHGVGLVVGSPARTVETQAWVQRGWAQPLNPARADVRARGPVVRAVEPDDLARDEAAASARIPHVAWLVAKEGLRQGPVLVSVGRPGYVGALACQTCREPAVCAACGGPLEIAAGGRLPSCTWCARAASTPQNPWACRACRGASLRAVGIGAQRTVEEIGRAFPGVRVLASTGDQPLRDVGDEPTLVVATSGVEPRALGGYAAVLILDAANALARPGMRAQEDAVNRWFAASCLARARAQVAIAAANDLPAVQALVRWDAAWFAERELADRSAAHLPPQARMAVLRGSPADTAEALAMLEDLPHRALGPVGDRTIIVVDRTAANALPRRLRAMTATRAAARAGQPVNVHVDPREP